MLLWMEVRSLRGLFLTRLAYTDGERMGWYEMEIRKEGYGGAAGRQAYYLPAAWCYCGCCDGAGGGGYLLCCAVSRLHGGVHNGAAAAHLLGGDLRQTLRHLLRRGVGECKSAVSQFWPTALFRWLEYSRDKGEMQGVYYQHIADRKRPFGSTKSVFC